MTHQMLNLCHTTLTNLLNDNVDDASYADDDGDKWQL